jgi:hypothetical protein
MYVINRMMQESKLDRKPNVFIVDDVDAEINGLRQQFYFIIIPYSLGAQYLI